MEYFGEWVIIPISFLILFVCLEFMKYPKIIKEGIKYAKR